jgi:hypothetical protein
VWWKIWLIASARSSKTPVRGGYPRLKDGAFRLCFGSLDTSSFQGGNDLVVTQTLLLNRLVDVMAELDLPGHVLGAVKPCHQLWPSQLNAYNTKFDAVSACV